MARPACSFCGKSQDEVARLIAGPSVFICNECVDLCVTTLAENPPAPTRLGHPNVLVQVPDGSVHGCREETAWIAFEHDGERYEWCTTRGYIRGELPLRVLAVRQVGDDGPAKGMAFPLKTDLTEEHARRVVEGMWKSG